MNENLELDLDFVNYQRSRIPQRGRAVSAKAAAPAVKPATRPRSKKRPKQEVFQEIDEVGGEKVREFDQAGWRDFVAREKAGEFICLWFSLPGPKQDGYRVAYTVANDPNAIRSQDYD